MAAWRSSLIAQRAATRAHLPYVWPAIRYGSDGPDKVVYVRLHNDGPGLAQDVVAARYEPAGPGGDWIPLEQSSVIRGIRNSETFPPADAEELSLEAHLAGDDVFSVAVRWTDTASQRWELIVPQDPKQLTGKPRKLRHRFWQRWRPPAEW